MTEAYPNTFLTRIQSDAAVPRKVICRCVCGTVKSYFRSNIHPGKTISCGCKRAVQVKKPRKHGHGSRGFKSLTYRSWQSMMNRCTNPASDRYAAYGKSGIRVCKRWLTFENFLADMGERPSVQYTVDRVDGTKGYNPHNCRWATKKEQSVNRKTTVLLTINGQTLCAADWSRFLGLHPDTVGKHIRAGMSPERAVSAGCLRPEPSPEPPKKKSGKRKS